MSDKPSSSPIITQLSAELQKPNPEGIELSRLLGELQQSNPDLYEELLHDTDSVVSMAAQKMHSLRATMDYFTPEQRLAMRKAFASMSLSTLSSAAPPPISARAIPSNLVFFPLMTALIPGAPTFTSMTPRSNLRPSGHPLTPPIL